MGRLERRWTKTHGMSRTTTPRTQKTVATATMTKTRIKRRHPRLVHAAALSLRRRERKNDRLLARKRSLGLRPGSDPGRSQRRSRVPNREREADLGKRNALDPAPRSVRGRSLRSVKVRAQNPERGKKAGRDQSLEKEKKTGPSLGSALGPGNAPRIESMRSRRSDRVLSCNKHFTYARHDGT